MHADENAGARPLAPRAANDAAAPGAGSRRGIAAYVDGSPSKGRVRKALRADGTVAGGGGGTPVATNPLFTRPRDDVYETVVDKASKLFAVIRQTVVCELAPSALKSAFLDPLHSSLFNEVSTAVVLTSTLLTVLPLRRGKLYVAIVAILRAMLKVIWTVRVAAVRGSDCAGLLVTVRLQRQALHDHVLR